jgi:exopolysaccharide biosynthesis protein
MKNNKSLIVISVLFLVILSIYFLITSYTDKNLSISNLDNKPIEFIESNEANKDDLNSNNEKAAENNIQKTYGSDNKINRTKDNSINLVSTNKSIHLLEISNPFSIEIGRSIESRGMTTSDIAKQNNAVAAVNGGAFFYHQNGDLSPLGAVIHDGEFITGEDIDGTIELVGIDKEGYLITGNFTIAEINCMGITEGLSFGPPLILEGEKQFLHGDGGYGTAPRTAIGQRADGTILLAVNYGYENAASIVDIQNLLFDYGACTAANLDGGTSTTMYYKGNVVSKEGERLVPTAIIVK